jgi:hypothetical protein
MMATIVKGSTISATVTAQLMSDMVELAAISNIDRTSLDTTKITDAYQAAVAPGGPYDRELWQASGRNGLSSYDVASAKWRGARTRSLMSASNFPPIRNTMPGVAAVISQRYFTTCGKAPRHLGV